MAIFTKTQGNSIVGTSENDTIQVDGNLNYDGGNTSIDGGDGNDELLFAPASAETLVINASTTHVERFTIDGTTASGIDASALNYAGLPVLQITRVVSGVQPLKIKASKLTVTQKSQNGTHVQCHKDCNSLN
jgi:hypothetical protein